MKYSHKLSDGVHILAYVDIYQDADLSSGAIAASIEANPSLVRRLMAQLVKAGLLTSQPGAAAPALARPAAEISLLDVYQALEGNKELLHIDEKTNPQCIVGGNIQASLNVAYAQVQQAAEAQMAAISLQGIISDILQREAAKH
ncbi:Rrf2 family transcriptional regulator [Lacticaseibacillus suilingensis]|jgi:DNA-binding IscR family transcriptional regulator|uniref:Rrf2 family transcriptional regulator n=1 Tax=Lacticaseibacillus suilingensis TaxID=2799577 RepID=A0ABW4BE10_9LACO|nr:Rrf2 family transcriptional regulator [Lacticaseibacillus suilingensis]MCI1895100.1 Rrf2 family transcriptional regulator [Lactobacillus sp.]MCI1917546.1 Rrf2 family transcriptional regulator [Lactobacillus sp.]MCI1972993.1 Rrf2 family transcriptional regulator [Lactobacillus sp.]MCI2017177.1 Rrf2 family transcriptional regulator [Lactobacillus sp.]MCI2037538.1 Rrf2 family transcriptional regulator [Lactobacillus sp.]